MIEVHQLDLSSPAAFAVVGGLALIDGVIPLVPARTAVIAVGVIAGTGDRRAYPLLAAATVAAFASDNISYGLGARLWPRLAPHLLRGNRLPRMWHWFERRLATHGTALIAMSRVIPGGPTPITLMAGSVGFPITRFRWAAALSALLWSGYAFGIGLVGQSATQRPLIALILGICIGAILNFMLRARFRRADVSTLRRPPTDTSIPAEGEPIFIQAPHRSDWPDTDATFPGDAPMKESKVHFSTSPTADQDPRGTSDERY